MMPCFHYMDPYIRFADHLIGATRIAIFLQLLLINCRCSFLFACYVIFAVHMSSFEGDCLGCIHFSKNGLYDAATQNDKV